MLEKDSEIGYLIRETQNNGTSLRKKINTLSFIYDAALTNTRHRRASVLTQVDNALIDLLYQIPRINEQAGDIVRVGWDYRGKLSKPETQDALLVIDAKDFPTGDEMLGEETLAAYLVQAHERGWDNFMVFNARGQKFIGTGFGMPKEKVSIDIFGDSGNYLGSGVQNTRVTVHGAAQDMAGQIMNGGLLVIHGDVGQTFMYSAKAGEAYVLGNAAGRPLINAVGSPRVVINGTCLDYLAESFMAGDPLNGGGFVILNGVKKTCEGLSELETPYPGGNLLSLASGGAIYVQDPHRKVSDDQLNGGILTNVTRKDWEIVYPYLKKNEDLFDITIDDLLSNKSFDQAYRKVVPVHNKVLE